jgi:hypothetical protein
MLGEAFVRGVAGRCEEGMGAAMPAVPEAAVADFFAGGPWDLEGCSAAAFRLRVSGGVVLEEVECPSLVVVDETGQGGVV